MAGLRNPIRGGAGAFGRDLHYFVRVGASYTLSIGTPSSDH